MAIVWRYTVALAVVLFGFFWVFFFLPGGDWFTALSLTLKTNTAGKERQRLSVQRTSIYASFVHTTQEIRIYIYDSS